MNLSNSQKKYLRKRGHQLSPVILVAGSGLSKTVLQEFDSTIAHHELIKVRIRAADRTSRDALINELCQKGSADLIQQIGNIALIYRANPDSTKIQLP
jgi:RNA-binding protein